MIISIVTPVLNGGPYFQDCIKSVQAAATSEIEIEHIICDGGSTDGSAELAEAHGLRVLRNSEIGLIARMNLGYRAAQGELLGFLGADDILLDGAAEAVAQAYRQSGRQWVVGGLRWISKDGQCLGELRAPPRWLTVATFTALEWNVISPVVTFMKRDFFFRIGGYDEHYLVSADMELFARALDQEPFERVARPLACWRLHGQNFSVIHKSRGLDEVIAIRRSMGLKNDYKQQVQRYAMKAWINASNPEWCRRKMLDKARSRLAATRASSLSEA